MEEESEVDSVEQVYWEDHGQKMRELQRKMMQEKNDPIKLLERLEEYSNQKLINMSMSDKEALINQIEEFLRQGITPLQKYYDELK